MTATYRTVATDHWTDNTSTDQITALTGDLLIAEFTGIASVDPAPTCSDDQAGGTWAFVCRARSNGSTNETAVFVRNNLVASNVSPTVHPVLSGGVTASAISVTAHAGMILAGLAAIRQFAVQENGAAAGTPSVTFSQAVLTTNPTIAIIGSNRNGTGVTAPAGWTARSDDGTGAPDVGTAVSTRDSGFTGTTVTWGSTSANAFGAIAIELDSSAGGGPPVIPGWPPAAPSLGITRTTTTGGDVIRADDIGPDKVQLMKVRGGPPGAIDQQRPMFVSGVRAIRYYEELRDYAENRRDAYRAWLESLGGGRSRAGAPLPDCLPSQVQAVDPTTTPLAGFWRDITAANQAGVASAGTSGSRTLATLGVDPTFNTTSLSGHPTALFGAGTSLLLSGTFSNYATSTRFAGWMVVKISSITNNPCPISDDASGVTYVMSTGNVNGPIADVEVTPLNGDTAGLVARSLGGYLGQFCVLTWNYDSVNNQVGINEIPGLAGDGVGTHPTSIPYGIALGPLTNHLLMGDAFGAGAALGEVAELGIWGTNPTAAMWKGMLAYCARQYGGGLAVPL